MISAETPNLSSVLSLTWAEISKTIRLLYFRLHPTKAKDLEKFVARYRVTSYILNGTTQSLACGAGSCSPATKSLPWILPARVAVRNH